MSDFEHLLSTRFLHNTLLEWAWALLAIVLTFLILPLVRSLIRARRARWPRDLAASPALDLLAQLVARTSRLLRVLLALYLAEKILTLPGRLDHAFDVVIIIGAWLQAGVWASVALRFFITLRQRRSSTDDGAAQSSIDVLMFCAQLIIWAIFALLALGNLGINVTALVAGLGVGGIAVALAVQTILSDLFASLSIAFDRPFVVGDTLRLDDYEGVVEHIGIKSTRLRSVSGEQIVLANADVLKSRVRNLGRMTERRVLFRLYISYDTSAAKVAQVSPLVQQAISAQSNTRFVSCLLGLLGAYALEFEVIYFVSQPRGIEYLRTVDAVNRAIYASLAASGIALTYPTQRSVNAPTPMPFP